MQKFTIQNNEIFQIKYSQREFVFNYFNRFNHYANYIFYQALYA